MYPAASASTGFRYSFANGRAKLLPSRRYPRNKPNFSLETTGVFSFRRFIHLTKLKVHVKDCEYSLGCFSHANKPVITLEGVFDC